MLGRIFVWLVLVLTFSSITSAAGHVLPDTIGLNVRQWWFVFRRENWFTANHEKSLYNELFRNCVSEGFQFNKLKGHSTLFESKTFSLGVVFIVLKTHTQGPHCAEKELSLIYNRHRGNLSGWGEVPYSKAIKDIQQKILNNGHANPLPIAIPHPNIRLEPDSSPDMDNNTALNATINFDSNPSNELATPPPDNGTIYPRAGRGLGQFFGFEEEKQELWQDYTDDRQKLSQPPLTDLKSVVRARFATRWRTTNGVRVYLLDTGFDQRHSEFKFGRDRLNHFKKYLWAGPEADDRRRDWEELDYRGTGLLSRVMGSRIGVAPGADAIPVQIINRHGYYTTANLFDAMIQTYDHIHRDSRSATIRSVILAAWMYDETYPNDPNSLFANVYDPPGSEMRTNELVRWLSSQLTQLFKNQGETIIVTAAGSDKIHRTEFLAPARDQLVFPDVVVTIGDTNLQDQKKIDDTKRGMRIRAWAPGDNVFAASYNYVKEETLRPVSGSSYAAAQAAGLLAWFIAGDFKGGVRGAINRLYSLAYPRVLGGPPMIYNGAERSEFL